MKINNSVPIEQVKGQTVAGPKNSTSARKPNDTEVKQNNINTNEYQHKGKIINTTA